MSNHIFSSSFTNFKMWEKPMQHNCYGQTFSNQIFKAASTLNLVEILSLFIRENKMTVLGI